MSFYVLYYIEVKPEKVATFQRAWISFSSEIQNVFPGSGSTLFQAESGMYTCISKWKSEAEWHLFWKTKETRFHSSPIINECLMRPIQAKALQPIRSTFHTMEYTDSQLTITKATSS